MALPWLHRSASGWLAVGSAMAARGPSACHLCQRWPARRVCDDCMRQLATAVPRCATCALRVPAGVERCGACIGHPGHLQACQAAVDYAYPWDGIVQAFKFGGDPGWAPVLAALLREHAPSAALVASADVLLPVPLTAQRLRERGYDQAGLLAQALDHRRTLRDGLLRLRDAPAQASLGRDARLRNLRGAFALEPHEAPRVRGRRVLLVDDVMTTGATLEAAARVLWDAGAAWVGAVVVARTPAPGTT